MLSTSMNLIQRIRDHRDETAWDRFHSIYSPYLFGWLRRAGIAPEDAEDIVQDALRVITNQLPSFQHNQRAGAFRCWLRTILVHRIRDFQRARAIRNRVQSASNVLGHLADQLERFDSSLSIQFDRDHDSHVLRKLMSLVQKDFETRTWRAFSLVVLEGIDASRVAERLHLSIDSVYAAKSRVLKRLRQEAATFLS
ncbi:MAG: RNA polymerase sigma factor [Gemmataceae bacterium]